jgi:predicted HTH domain antitoxin
MGEAMTITVQLSDALFEDLATSPEEIDREIRLAAAIHLYSRGLISQGKGAEIAGMSRWDFIEALGHAEVPACQVTPEELKDEVERAYRAHRQRVAADPSDQDRTD